MNLSSFKTNLKEEFIALIDLINDNDFKVGLIGGVVRDYLLVGPDKDGEHDYDCELRPYSFLPSDELLKKFRNLKKIVSSKFKTRELPFEILRVMGEGFEAELSLPRIESFSTDFHHSNFEATYISDPDYTNGFKRRDLTINAVMVEFYKDEISLVDPLGGVQDIKDKVLKPCSEDFSKDPVRFLRALRFQLLFANKGLHFELDSAISEHFSKLKLNDFTDHYLQMEMFKSNAPLNFLTSLLSLIKEGKASYPQPLIMDFDELWRKRPKRDFLTYALFLSKEDFELFLQRLNIADKKKLPHMPWKLRVREINPEWIKLIEFLNKIDSDIHQFYFDHGQVDLSPGEMESLLKIKVDLENVENRDKRLYKYAQQVRSYFDY